MFRHIIGFHISVVMVLFEVYFILRLRRFASRWPFSLPLCLVVSAMKKMVIKIGGGCLFTDVISRLPRGNKLS
jgi:ATP sulfurylase